MSNITYGPTSWNNKSNENTEFGKGTEFIRLSFGSNLVRLVTQPFQINKHAVEAQGGKVWGFNQLCAKRQKDDPCPLCDMGHRAKRKYLVGVIDKKNGQYRILEITGGVYDKIVTLKDNPVWGGPPEGSTVFPYDMDLIKNQHPKSPGDTYGLVPYPPKPLSAAEIAIAETADLAELERRSTPPSFEKVKERLNKAQADGMIIENNSSSLFSNPGKETDDGGVDDSDSFFKDYSQKSQSK